MYPENIRSVCEVKIEQKWFLISRGRMGRTVCLKERTRNATYELELDADCLEWILLKLGEYIVKPQSYSKFNRFRGRESVISMQKFENGRGSYIEISKYSGHGNRQRIIIPGGRFEWGWKRVNYYLSSFLKLKSEKPKRFTEGRNQLDQLQKIGRSRPSHGKQGDARNETYDQIPACAVKDWSKSLIITRDCVNIPWDLVRRTLGKAVQRFVQIFPFQANKALWWPHNEEDAAFYLRLKKVYLEKQVTLSFEQWRPQINCEEEVFECCNSWVRVLGLPWDLWSTEIFRSIGGQCGGLLSISQDTIYLKDLSAAKIKVVGLDGGFINRNLKIITQRGPMDIRILVDSVNIHDYGKIEKRSYAQVVANGARMPAGWSTSKKVDGNDCSMLPETDKKDMDSEKSRNHVLSMEDQGCDSNKKEDNTVSDHRENQHLPPSIHADRMTTPKKKCFDRAYSSDSKVIKILSRVVPKVITEFHHSQISTLNDTSKKTPASEEGVVRSRTPSPKIEKTYQRRNRKQATENCYQIGNQGIINQVVISPMKNLDDMIGTEGREFEGDHDNMSEDDLFYSETDSHISSRSAISATFENNLEELADLFNSPKNVGTSDLLQETVISSSKAGQVLSDIHSNFLHHPVNFQCTLPSSSASFGLSSGFLGKGGKKIDEKPGNAIELKSVELMDSQCRSDIGIHDKVPLGSGKGGEFKPECILKKDLDRLKRDINYDGCSSSRGHSVSI